MGHTLDELLDATGISDLESMGLAKNAAPVTADVDDQLLKLAERCERAAAEPQTSLESDRRLAEKTAAIAVIAHTLSEIEAVTGADTEKVAPVRGRTAAFIERALEAGHPPEKIAAFLKEAGGSSAEQAGEAVQRSLSSQRLRQLVERIRSGVTPERLKAVGIPAASGAAGLVAGRTLAGHHARKAKPSHDDTTHGANAVRT